MEALGFLGDSGFSTIEPDGRGGIGGRLGIGNFAGEDNSALDCLSQYSLTRLRILIPAESLSRQERITEPLEGDEGMTATFGFGQGAAQLPHPVVKIDRIGWVLSVIFFKAVVGATVGGAT